MSRPNSNPASTTGRGAQSPNSQRAVSPSSPERQMSTLSIPPVDNDVGRPPILTDLLNARRQKDEPQPKKFQDFERMVEDNDVQLARYDFLKLKVFYDGGLNGPTGNVRPKRGGSAIEIIFKYYASRRQADDMTGPIVMTFEEAEEQNKTMDGPELAKFCKDFFPSVFSQREINWLFSQANKAGGISDGNAFTMDIEEFTVLLVQMACQLVPNGTAEERVRYMGKAMHLSDPRWVLSRLDYLGRTDAGFGAWKAEQPEKVQPIDASKRCVLGVDAIKNVPEEKPLADLVLLMETSFPMMNLVDWVPFDGQYVSIAIPRGGVRKGKHARFRLVLGNTAPRAFIVLSRVENLPFLSLKYPAPRPIAPGMDMTLDIELEDLPVGEHLGAIVFSVEEEGPELFRCPVYVRVSKENSQSLADSTANILAKFVPREKLVEECRKIDTSNRGKIPSIALAKVFSSLKVEIAPERFMSLVSVKVEQDADGAMEYAEFADTVYGGLSNLTTEQRDRLRLGAMAMKLEPLERSLALGKVAIPLSPSLAGLIQAVELSSSRGGTPSDVMYPGGGGTPSLRSKSGMSSSSRVGGGVDRSPSRLRQGSASQQILGQSLGRSR